MKMMRCLTHETNSEVPEGFAILVLDDSGFVGTHNGWPHAGQPALYPVAQAHAIEMAWNYIVLCHPSLDELVHPEVMDEATWDWFDKPKAGVKVGKAGDGSVSPVESALRCMLEVVEEPPAPNCSCHVSPPCNDCVEYGALREAIAEAKKALKGLRR